MIYVLNSPSFQYFWNFISIYGQNSVKILYTWRHCNIGLPSSFSYEINICFGFFVPRSSQLNLPTEPVKLTNDPVPSSPYQRYSSVLPSIPKACRPTSLHYRVSFDVGIVIIHKICCGHRLHPNHALPSCLAFCLGRTLNSNSRDENHTYQKFNCEILALLDPPSHGLNLIVHVPKFDLMYLSLVKLAKRKQLGSRQSWRVSLSPGRG